MTVSDSSDSEGLAPVIPLFRVVRGTPSPEELAALTAVLAVASGGSSEDAPAPRSLWSSRASALRKPLTPGPGAWVNSFR